MKGALTGAGPYTGRQPSCSTGSAGESEPRYIPLPKRNRQGAGGKGYGSLMPLPERDGAGHRAWERGDKRAAAGRAAPISERDRDGLQSIGLRLCLHIMKFMPPSPLVNSILEPSKEEHSGNTYRST